MTNTLNHKFKDLGLPTVDSLKDGDIFESNGALYMKSSDGASHQSFCWVMLLCREGDLSHRFVIMKMGAKAQVMPMGKAIVFYEEPENRF